MSVEQDAGPSRTMRQALILLVVAFASRCIVFGDPIIHIDEQYYLLVGQRMLDGALPYVDAWDRKPFGLFLLYEGLAWIGGGTVWGYQIAATLAAAATAFIITRVASRFAAPDGALTAGIVYLLYLLTFNGVGGQSSVFYNLLTALAALCVMAALKASSGRALLGYGVVAMLIMGVAIQVKYTVVFEGALFGLALLWQARRLGWSLPVIGGFALLLMGIALLPTIAVFLSYQAMGQSEAYIQANFQSIFGRREDRLASFARLVLTTALLSPFIWVILRGRAAVREAGVVHPDLAFVRIWAPVAVGAYLLFGAYYDHYAIPLLVPLTMLAAPGLSWNAERRRPAIALVGMALVSGIAIVTIYMLQQGGRSDLDRLTAIVRPHLTGCMFVYEGDPALYSETGACWPTRFNFPGHLNNIKEANALPIVEEDEVRRILATRPGVVVMADEPRRTSNLSTRAVLTQGLRGAYREVGRTEIGQRGFVVYALTNPAP